MRIKALLALLLALALLTACHAPEKPPETVTEDTAYTEDTAPDTLPDTAPDTTPDTVPDTAPDTTPDAAPEPELTLTGDRVVVDGLRLAVWEAEGQKYVAKSAARRAFGRELEGETLTARGAEYLPWPRIVEELDCPTLTDPEDGTVYYSPEQAYELPEDVNVSVLMYHAVSDKPWGLVTLFVSPASFEEQLKYLTENGFDPIWFSDLSHVEDYDKPVILTFDDGYDNNFTVALPLLQKYGVKATIFVITDYIGQKRYMTAEQVAEAAASGLVSIQSHTATHPDLRSLSEEQLAGEFDRSRLEIARITGRIPTVLAYPSGRNNRLTRKVAASYYKLGVRMDGGLWNTSSDPYLVSRFYVSRDHTLGDFKKKVAKAGS